MYGDYKEAWSMVDERMNSAVHENYPEWKKSRDRRNKQAPSNVTYVNQHGDRFTRDAEGRVATFRYRHCDTTYSVTYDDDNNVVSVSSSSGWTWTKMDNGEGWLVRNYFDAWHVKADEAGDVVADENGLRCVSGDAMALGLPVRP
jgi:gamma-glutamyltranspeptidase